MDMQRWRLHEEIRGRYENTNNSTKVVNTVNIKPDNVNTDNTTIKPYNAHTVHTTSTSVQKDQNDLFELEEQIDQLDLNADTTAKAQDEQLSSITKDICKASSLNKLENEPNSVLNSQPLQLPTQTDPEEIVNYEWGYGYYW